jgi:hypothetical protein
MVLGGHGIMLEKTAAQRNGRPDFYNIGNYIVNDAYDRIISYIALQKERNGFKTFTVTGCALTQARQRLP